MATSVLRVEDLKKQIATPMLAQAINQRDAAQDRITKLHEHTISVTCANCKFINRKGLGVMIVLAEAVVSAVGKVES